MSEPKRWGLSILASQVKQQGFGTKRDNCHTGCMIEATSEAEANGIGLKIAKKLFPMADDWRQHDVFAFPLEKLVTPETAAFLPE